MASPQQHFDAARKYQEFYSEAVRDVGVRIPEPRLGESVNNYRRETLRHLKREFLPRNHPLYQVQFRALADDALQIFESQLLKAVPQERLNPATVSPGTLRMIIKRDPQNGSESRTFIGQDSFVKLPNFGCDMQCAGGYREGRRTTLRQMQQTAERLLRMVK